MLTLPGLASISRVIGIAGMHHHIWPRIEQFSSNIPAFPKQSSKYKHTKTSTINNINIIILHTIKSYSTCKTQENENCSGENNKLK
jgi:hypothetical protein